MRVFAPRTRPRRLTPLKRASIQAAVLPTHPRPMSEIVVRASGLLRI